MYQFLPTEAEDCVGMTRVVDLRFLDDSHSLPDEGYRSADTSPDWTNVQSFTFEKDVVSHCCGLGSDTWKWSANSPSVMDSPKTNNATEAWKVCQSILDELSTPQPLRPLPRDYKQTIFPRAIVTLDVEVVESDPASCHSIDQVMAIATGTKTAPNKLTMRKPWGLCMNSRTEQIYVADRQYHVILVYGPDGAFQFQFGEPGSEPGKFNRPAGIAYDSIGNRLYIVDKDNHRIQVFSANGEYQFHFGERGMKPGRFWYPWGIAVSRDGEYVAVADARNHRVQLLAADGTFIRQFGIHSRGTEKFNYPRGIAFDNAGQYIYVTDFNLHCVFRLDLAFNHLEKIIDELELNRPSGIDVDAEGNIVVCDTRNHCLKVFYPDGRPLAKLRRLRENAFDLPLDIAVMPAGFLAVLDLNGRVRVF